MDRANVVSCRLSDEEQAAFIAIMHQERRRQSETLRELVRAEAERRGLWPPPMQVWSQPTGGVRT